MEQVIKDLRSDILMAIDSSYAEYESPDMRFLIENVKGIFKSTDSYNYPDLKNKIIESIEFLFSENYVPSEEVVKNNIEAVFLSWRYEN